MVFIIVEGKRQRSTTIREYNTENSTNIEIPTPPPEPETETEPEQPPKAPIFAETLFDQTVLAGENATLKCKVRGYPLPTVTWIKDNEPLKTSHRKQLNFSEDGICTLTISGCDASDGGIYMCNAENESGVQTTDCVLTIATKSGEDKHLVTVEEAPPTEKEKETKKPKFTRKPAPKITVNEGTKVEMTAKAIGNPNPTLKWLKDGKEISRTNKSYKMWLKGNGESVLEIECAVSKSAAKFTCVATNSEGIAETETELVVQRKINSLLKKEIEHVTLQTNPVPPKFISELTDIGITSGHPATLKCKITGDPEPTLRWFFVDDSRKTIPVSEMKPSVWTEYREGEEAELRANAVFKLEQGSYSCIATNEKGTAMSSCYLLVGDSIDDAPAGPPRFIKCLRDIWVPLSEKVEMQVEVGGEPMPDLTWYHNDETIIEGRDYKVSYPSSNQSILTIPMISLIHMGRYSVEASNVHGIVRTNAQLMIGEKLEHSEVPSFSQHITEPLSIQSPKRKADSEGPLSPNDPKRIKSQIQKKGAAPSFVIGLADMELKAGDTAAVAGKLAKKRRHRHGNDDPQSLKDAVVAKLNSEADEEVSSPLSPLPAPLASTSRRQTGETTLEEIRQAITKRNKRICHPKFLVKPKPKKSIEEFKSLRLKAALSGNPAPEVFWDREGIILETGNKFSIYNDGDFYYLEVHHISSFDVGFYNCSATNSEGFDVCTSEIEIETKDSPMDKLKKRLRRESIKPSFIEVLPGRMKVKAGDSLSLECSVSGYPSPKIQWLRNGVSLIPQRKGRYSMFYDGECATLSFDTLSPSDAGTYSLQCENSAGTATTQVNLEVEKPTIIIEKDGIPPKFLTPKQKQKSVGGSEIQLKAEILEGTEPISFRWILNKVQIQDSLGFKYSRNGKDSILTIKDAFPEDSGIYTCIAENQYGVARCYIDLSINTGKLFFILTVML
uniref:Ig-like domain-containing protein n=1 Tax=Panagrolaimus davidi TaxID=227884 RepID=A0A914Q9F2_9BILA